MKNPATRMRRSGTVRCAIYTRKSSEEGLDQEFDSVQAQREACEAFITASVLGAASQRDQEADDCPQRPFGRFADHGALTGARPMALSVEPDVFEAPAVVDAVDHRRKPVDIRLPATRSARMVNDRSGSVLGKSPLDLPH